MIKNKKEITSFIKWIKDVKFSTMKHSPLWEKIFIFNSVYDTINNVSGTALTVEDVEKYLSLL